MSTESIFSFLSKDKTFKNVYKTCLELEKAIANEMFDSALNRSRVAIEEFLEIIIKKDQQDKKLSKEVYSKYTPLNQILYRCERKKYIDFGVYNKLTKFNNDYGNAGSHKNDKKFTLDDVKYAHELIFNFSVDVFKRFDSRFEKEYIFDLSYLDENKNFTKEEADEIIKDTNIQEVSTDGIIEEITDKGLFLTKNQFETVIKPLTNNIEDLSSIDFITSENLDSVLTNYDESIQKNIKEAIENYQKQNLLEISETINNLEEKQITISQINDLINQNNDTIKNEILISIKEVAGELIKSHLEGIVTDFKQTPIIENNKVIEPPNYEVVKSGDSFEIREIEELLGIPENCPKCNTKLIKGSTKCPKCGYDLFDELNKRCPKCGRRVPLGSKFCIRCGNDLEKNKCSKCGYVNEKNSKFCIKCGNTL